MPENGWTFKRGNLKVGKWSFVKTTIFCWHRLEGRTYSNETVPPGVRVHSVSGGQVFLPDPDGAEFEVAMDELGSEPVERPVEPDW